MSSDKNEADPQEQDDFCPTCNEGTCCPGSGHIYQNCPGEVREHLAELNKLKLFKGKVGTMRDLQRRYFKTKNEHLLLSSKEAEKEIDELLSNQGGLFSVEE